LFNAIIFKNKCDAEPIKNVLGDMVLLEGTKMSFYNSFSYFKMVYDYCVNRDIEISRVEDKIIKIKYKGN